MARYIFCEQCNNKVAKSAHRYSELYESIEGTALKDMFCDGGCFGSVTKPILKGEKCFAAVLLNSKTHPNYEAQHPDNWADEFILTKQ
jgi:hypothetical protein